MCQYEELIEVVGRGQMLTIFVLVISLELFVAFSLFFEIRLPQRLIFFGDDNVADLDVGGVVGLETGSTQNTQPSSKIPDQILALVVESCLFLLRIFPARIC